VFVPGKDRAAQPLLAPDTLITLHRGASASGGLFSLILSGPGGILRRFIGFVGG
jgi:hypothetical protein